MRSHSPAPRPAVWSTFPVLLSPFAFPLSPSPARPFPLALTLTLALALLAPALRAFNPSGQRWSPGTVPMHLQLGPAATPLSDGSASWGAAAESALLEWNRNLTAVQFSVNRDSTAPVTRRNGINNVFFSSTVYGDAWDSRTLAVTLHVYDPRTQRYAEADVVFNSNLRWDSYRGALRTVAGPGTEVLNDFRRVALHEFGHVLGLNHPDDVGQNVPAVMNARTSGTDVLTPDDIAGGRAIYDDPSAPKVPLLSASGVTYAREAFPNGTIVNLILEASTIRNEGEGPANALRLELWGMPERYIANLPPGSINLATANVAGSLAAGAAISAFSAKIPFVRPPDGSYYVAMVLTEFTGGSGSGYTVRFAANFDEPLTLGNPAAPAITRQPINVSATAGSSASFTVAATGQLPLTYQWRKDGAPVAGATNPSLVLSGVQAAAAGTYSVVVTNSLGTAVSENARLILGNAADPGRLVNMSIRTSAGTGDATLIVGVGLGGARTSGAKPVLLRAVGPTLAAFGVGGALTDTVMTVFQGSASVATNDDWAGGFNFGSVGAFDFATPVRDSALYNPALATGAYSIQISGKGGATGVALAEIYDATPNSAFTPATPRLVNVSARTQVGTGDNILIAGFVIGGTTPVRVLVRAVGPTLGVFGVGGVLADPVLVISSGSSLVARNDNWGGTPELVSAFSSVGAFALSPATSLDAAVIATLAPGSYTAQISGAPAGTTTGTGVALVEVYELP